MSRLDWRKAKKRDADPANTNVPNDFGIESDARSGRRAPSAKDGGFKFPRTKQNDRAFPAARDGTSKGSEKGRWPKKP